MGVLGSWRIRVNLVYGPGTLAKATELHPDETVCVSDSKRRLALTQCKQQFHCGKCGTAQLTTQLS